MVRSGPCTLPCTLCVCGPAHPPHPAHSATYCIPCALCILRILRTPEHLCTFCDLLHSAF